jgi:hypothetical protein
MEGKPIAGGFASMIAKTILPMANNKDQVLDSGSRFYLDGFFPIKILAQTIVKFNHTYKLPEQGLISSTKKERLAAFLLSSPAAGSAAGM